MTKIPETSRAAVLRRFGEPLKIEDVPVPHRIEPHALLVRTLVGSICGTDVHMAHGELSLKVDLPIIIGHEMVGEIVAMGDGSERDSVGQELKVGDRILWTHTSCNSCFYCTVARQPTLCDNRRAYMYESMDQYPYLLGGFSEYGYVLPESGRIRVPDTISNEVASLCSCAFRSVMHAMSNLGAIDPSETVLVQGVGPLGLLATSVARMQGARKVIAIGSPAQRLEMAGELGADHLIAIETTSNEERLDLVKSLTNGHGADIVMEFAGHPSAFSEGLNLVRKGGRVLTVGQIGDDEVTFKPSTIVKKNIRLFGSFSGDTKSYWRALQFVERNQERLPFSKMLTGRFKLDEVNVAIERMSRMEEIKPVIELT